MTDTATAETLGVQGFLNMMNAEQYVVDHHLADVVTRSFGAAEDSFSNYSVIQICSCTMPMSYRSRMKRRARSISWISSMAAIPLLARMRSVEMTRIWSQRA